MQSVHTSKCTLHSSTESTLFVSAGDWPRKESRRKALPACRRPPDVWFSYRAATALINYQIKIQIKLVVWLVESNESFCVHVSGYLRKDFNTTIFIIYLFFFRVFLFFGIPLKLTQHVVSFTVTGLQLHRPGPCVTRRSLSGDVLSLVLYVVLLIISCTLPHPHLPAAPALVN